MSELWALTTYFNPCRYENKLTNLRRMAEGVTRQGAKLMILECAFNGDSFEVPEDVADSVRRFRSDSVMFLKERLLNEGLGLIRGEHLGRCFAWLDGDILFENEHWVADTLKALEGRCIVQLFERVYRFELCDASVPFAQQHWNREREVIAGHPGHAWAARVEGFPGFYDRAIVGGGDVILAWAIYRDAGLWPGFGQAGQFFSPSHLEDLEGWSADFYQKIGLSVDYVPGVLRHLEHGTLRRRDYRNRNAILRDHDFRPFEDLTLSNGVWEWATPKLEMHWRVAKYFADRQELEAA